MPSKREQGLAAQLKRKRSKMLSKKLEEARKRRPWASEDDFVFKGGKFVYQPDNVESVRSPKPVKGLAEQLKDRRKKKSARKKVTSGMKKR